MTKNTRAMMTFPSSRARLGFAAMLPALAIAVLLPSVSTAGVAPAGGAVAGIEPVGGATAAVAPVGGTAAETAQMPTVEGTWTTRISNRNNDDRIQIRLDTEHDGGHSTQGFGIDVAELEGLTMAQASGTATNVRFALTRDAGTITFEGNVRDGHGSGTFEFAAGARWVRQMAGLGYDWDDDEVFFLATQDVTVAWVQALQALGYTGLADDDLFAFAIHGVGPEFIRAMNDLGYRSIDADDLVAMRIHGVSPEFVRDIRRALGG